MTIFFSRAFLTTIFCFEPPVVQLPSSALFAPAASFSAGPVPGDLAIGDVNGDGKPDLVVSNFPAHNTISVLPGDGAGQA